MGRCISIHAPRGGSDQYPGYYQAADFISIHAPRGGSDGSDNADCYHAHAISIHAPRGGSDSKDAQFSLSIFGKNNKSW